MDPKLTDAAAGLVGDAPAGAQDVLRQLRATGARVTAARRAVIEALIAAGHEHMTAEDLASRVHSRNPEIHRATIYRTLEKLQEAGVITHVHLGHGPATFHIGNRPHHHAVCGACGTTVELPDDAMASIARHLRARHGWELTAQHFALSARCPQCQGD